MSVHIEIGGKPVAKGRGKIGTVNGKAMIFTPAKTRANENLIKMAAMEAMAGREPIAVAVNVEVWIFLPIPESFSSKKRDLAILGLVKPVTKPDIDNYVKSALDGINTIVIVDDNQVVNLTAYKRYDTRPRMSITVWEEEEELAL